jgi:hypothetical protein
MKMKAARMVSKTDFGLLRGFFDLLTQNVQNIGAAAWRRRNDDPHQSRSRGRCSPEMPMKRKA